MQLSHVFEGKPSIAILDHGIPLANYVALDLSEGNNALSSIDITNPKVCEAYITSVLERQGAQVAYGGYLEKRNLYSASARFSEGDQRKIHLGLDFWCSAGTKVITPLTGTVHSFKNNHDTGNYGPTIILRHEIGPHSFYSLYGHLSLDSLYNLYVGQLFKEGEVLATLGTPDINVGYAPHLHFQLILELGDYVGDYPGVCSEKDLLFYQNNCPNPNLVLNLV
ncbi:Peptidase M23 [Croceitalea dokdonensis DOKDO 023]|uniref:Peptidase M23 n=1 Tax=Croceitalea dokdonensis DOKDO 023 TaxID=1300341 RepID=A0A0N8H3W8_9FLAO|nr:peptidoglycan DD-metalloendopeptidase family protein [Croceitalea dokdonensis]KPM31732.1 Peptidase M23 [Croceitalea dokdonensis DOKDO 023]